MTPAQTLAGRFEGLEMTVQQMLAQARRTSAQTRVLPMTPAQTLAARYEDFGMTVKEMVAQERRNSQTGRQAKSSNRNKL